MHSQFKNSVLLWILAASGIFLSCHPGKVHYQETVVFEEETWNYSDTAHFAFSIQDTLQRYNLYLDVEHRDDYPFQNLYVIIHSKTPKGEIIKDQHSLELQEKDGFWMGDCQGKSCELRFILREGLAFAEIGDYKISIEQYSREENLKGIQSMGIYLEKADK
jgi:gliding motility-associated lipoprotein GldH